MRLSRTVVLVFLLLSLLVPAGLALAAPQPLDMKTDLNQDGIPDAFAEAVDEVARAKDKQAAIQALAARMPYQRETYALQKEAQALNRKLASARTSEEAERILARLRALRTQMEKDPVYSATLRALEKLYIQKGYLPQPASRTGIQAVNWSALQPGDVMMIRSGKLPWMSFVYAMWYTHTGNYHGSSLVYESNPDGVRLKPLSDWQQSGQYVGLARNNRKTASQVQGALAWAENRYGTDGRTPYNYWFPDKTTDSKLYCSQLTWKIHGYLGVDLDSNAWQYHLWLSLMWGPWVIPAVAYPAVAPDEVSYDSDLTIYSESWN